MKLPRPAPAYDVRDQAEHRAATERAINSAHARGEDVEVSPGRLIIKSPNGNRWSVTVSNAGVVAAAAI
jgi:hypothetical protein